MTSIIFKALLDSVRFDKKKGEVKIQLICASHVSLDTLTTIAPTDEPIKVTLESAQTKIEVFPIAPEVGDPITLEGEAAAPLLKDAAEKLRTKQPFKATSESPKEFKEDRKRAEEGLQDDTAEAKAEE